MFSDKTTICFVIKDSNYLQHILHFARNSEFFQCFHIRAFTRLPARSALDGTDILVVCDELLHDLGDLPYEMKHLRLSADKHMSISQGAIFKYQPLHNMFCELLEYYRSLQSFDAITNPPSAVTSFIAVFSLAGGSGKTTVAGELAESIAARGQNVLYLNLEDVPSPIWNLGGQNDAPTLSEFLYRVELDKTDRMYWNGKQHPQRKFYFLQPHVQFREMNRMEKQQFDSLLESIKQQHFFDYVVIDMSSQLSPLTFDCMNASDHICWLLTDEQSHLGKMEMLLSYAKQTELMEEWSWLGKCSFVLNKYIGYFLNAYLNETYDICTFLPYVSSWNQPNDHSRRLLEETQFKQALSTLFDERFAKRTAIKVNGKT
jgi:cellulose biosynthesis protein BcsQ